MKAVQYFGSYLPGDEASHTRRLEYSVKCVVQLFSNFSVDPWIMNVLDRAYNCFLINYKACIWGCMSSEMLKLCQVQELAPMHSEVAQWLYPEGILLTEKVIISAWRQCIPSKLHEPLAQEYDVTSQKIAILNYPVFTPHIISNDFTPQRPSLSLSRQSLFLAPNRAVAAWHHSTTPSCLSSFHLFPSLSQTTTCTKANDESLERATVSDLEICSSKTALETTTTNLPTDQGRTAVAQY